MGRIKYICIKQYICLLKFGNVLLICQRYLLKYLKSNNLGTNRFSAEVKNPARGFFLKGLNTGMKIKNYPNRGSPENTESLTKQQILMIEEAIASVGEFGEVHLVVEKRRLRFVVTKTSHDAIRYERGEFTGSK
jgi:hypothetical protein